MIELIKYIVNCFAEKPDEIDYDIVDDGKNVSVTITLSASDMGKVIGKHGKIARAIRQIMKTAAGHCGKKITVNIKDEIEDVE